MRTQPPAPGIEPDAAIPAPRRGRPRAAPANALPTVTVLRPRCPACGCPRLRKHRTLADLGDGASMWWVRCLNERCAQRYKVLLE